MVLQPTDLMSRKCNKWRRNYTMSTLGTCTGFRNLGAHHPPMEKTFSEKGLRESRPQWTAGVLHRIGPTWIFPTDVAVQAVASGCKEWTRQLYQPRVAALATPGVQVCPTTDTSCGCLLLTSMWRTGRSHSGRKLCVVVSASGFRDTD